MFELVVTSGALKKRRVLITERGVRIGRASSNDFPIPDAELSRNHCLVELSQAGVLSVSDLASANGTRVNGEDIGTSARTLKDGDVIEIGENSLLVVKDGSDKNSNETEKTVDLGLDANAKHETPVQKTPKSIRVIIWTLVSLFVIGAGFLVAFDSFFSSVQTEKAFTEITMVDDSTLHSLFYEKIDADATHIFRYSIALDSDWKLSVVSEDKPLSSRHVEKSTVLSQAARKRILEILNTKGFYELDDAYTASRADDENSLKRARIRVVRGSSVHDILVENTVEPEAFRRVREALEAFSRNELGIWALQYSREQLLNLSRESVALGDGKWADRESDYGNVSAAVAAYREAVFYLETINPKPETYLSLCKKLDNAVAELNARYEEQRFRSERAIKLSNWEEARDALRILLEIIPDKNDARHSEASAKLIDVEKRLAPRR